jgi:hypothetical protein
MGKISYLLRDNHCTLIDAPCPYNVYVCGQDIISNYNCLGYIDIEKRKKVVAELRRKK